jgi:FixJ family two-component response regulator
MNVADDPIVFVIDDEPEMRQAVGALLDSVGLRNETFASASEFLERLPHGGPCCLVLDVRLPWMSGIELQRHMAARAVEIPIVFVSGYADIPLAVQAMKAGATDFLTKPFRGQELLDAIHNAVSASRAALSEKARLAEVRRRADSLTLREREVMRKVIAGSLNKQIAAELGTSERTVKIHRANVMRKMGAESLPDLVRVAEKVRI